MKKIYAALLFCLVCLPVKATTLQEDYEQMRPFMDMLSLESGASIGLLTPYAEKGNSVAGYLLGVIYEEGKSVSQDKAKAFEYYSMSADKNPLAALKKADMQMMSDGVAYDLESARKIYENLQNNSDEVVSQKAKIRLEQIKVVEKKASLLASLEQKALEGNTVAQLEMADYALKVGNLVSAHTWFSVAVEDKHLASKEKDIRKFINALEGQMSLSDIVKAEKEAEAIRKIVDKQEK